MNETPEFLEDMDILNLDHQIKQYFKSEARKRARYFERLKVIETLLQTVCLRPKILFDLLMDKEIVESKLKTLDDADLYILQTQDIIQEYLKLINIPLDSSFRSPRIMEGRNTKMHELMKKRQKIAKRFSDIAKSFLPVDFLKSLGLLGVFGKECLLQSSSVVCSCGNDKDFIKDDDIYICQTCFSETTKLVNSSSYNDGSRINVCNKYIYDRKVHFKDCINQYQGKQNTNIDPKIYDNLEEQLVNHQIILPGDRKDKNGNLISQSKRYKGVTRAHILFFLKQLGYTKHYEDTILIHYVLTGKKPDNIEHLEEKLLADFDKLTEQYDLLFKNIERKNFINTQYVLFQLLSKHGYVCNKEDFAILKTTERKACHDEICKTLFDALGWKYMFVM